MTTPIGLDDLPGPHGLPWLGNLLDIDTHSPIDGFIALAREYGPIYKLSLPMGTRVMVSGADLVDDLCDDTRFDKQVGAGLGALRNSVAGSGLFTSATDDPLWHRAHNILMAPFSQQAMRDYVPRMLDIAGQLMDKWSRLNPGDEVNVPVDMTALTLDTIALCGFDYRFNSFYRETPHPFVAAMVRSLAQAQKRARQLPIQRRLDIQAKRRAQEDQEYMQTLVQGLISERRRRGSDADNTDLLGRMLEGVDPKSGLGLPDENIVAQCLTFLIAGHETTSGLLSFALFFLVKHPEIADRARAEVDEVLGSDPQPGYEQIRRLTYVTQILDETLRLWPTAPMFTRAPRQDEILAGRYAIPAGTGLSVIIQALHRDPAVWGDDADTFDPDRFTPERKQALPPNAYKPFGSGMRACIGRQFAMQEATLVLGMLLQRFEFEDHRDYQLHTRTALTVKPDEFYIRVRPRAGHTLGTAAPVAADTAPTPEPDAEPAAPGAGHGTPLTILFGSNLGTAEGIANKLAREGTERGFRVTVGTLDDHIDAARTASSLIVVCSSYNGMPPENAEQFVAALREPSLPDDAYSAVRYTVFGCGDTDWAATYQAVPTLIDTELERHGAQRIRPRGAGDAHGDFDAQYRQWHSELWSDFETALDLPSAAVAPPDGGGMSISIVNRQLANPVVLSYRAVPARVRVNRELVRDGATVPEPRSTRHVEVALPEGMDYRAGDHLGVLPRNSVDLIRRVMWRFGLDAGMYLTIVANPGTHTHLPVDESTPLLGILGSCVELQACATRSDIEVLAEYTEDPEQRAELLDLLDDEQYRDEVALPNVSVLDLLERFPACTVPFEKYLDLLPPLQPRYYSISSSPATDPATCSLTTGVLRAPARGDGRPFAGVCSNYLADMAPNSTIFVFRRRPTIPFYPPSDPSVPMIMIGAGTGLAPFRGFLQERATQKTRSGSVARSLLFFGCRCPGYDDIYSDELESYASSADVGVHIAYSRQPREGRRYAQDEMLAHQDEIWDLIGQGASIFVCGNARTLAPGVRAALSQIVAGKRGCSVDEAQTWLSGMRAEHRFLEDIWGGS
ncbi:bifunctional cytochrome P450/NADPH--P450 reductase [Rhodococcus zopfii]